jgi:hypothetical protein
MVSFEPRAASSTPSGSQHASDEMENDAGRPGLENQTSSRHTPSPLPPGSGRIIDLARISLKIFEFKELVPKIFRTKDLAFSGLFVWEHAQRDRVTC